MNPPKIAFTLWPLNEGHEMNICKHMECNILELQIAIVMMVSGLTALFDEATITVKIEHGEDVWYSNGSTYYDKDWNEIDRRKKLESIYSTNVPKDSGGE